MSTNQPVYRLLLGHSLGRLKPNICSVQSVQSGYDTVPIVKDEVVNGRVSKLVTLFCANKVEQEMETVIKVLQPGPLGIIEHKFSADEIRKANATGWYTLQYHENRCVTAFLLMYSIQEEKNTHTRQNAH
ncbi:hypothetical protein CR513_56656, partial [Mucuna pruriens]